MSIIGSFTGSDAGNDLARGKQQSDAALKSGYGTAQGYYDQAKGYYDPYSQTGQKANAMYADATGVNGQGAYQTAVSNFAGDPFRQSNEDYANQQLMRTFNARGGAYSGNAMLAAARGSLERGSTDWNNWLTRLQGEGAMGYGAAGAQAGLTAQQGGLGYQYGNDQATNDINYAKARAQNDNVLAQNVIGLGGTIVKAATPGYGGATPIGNMMSAGINAYNKIG